MSDTALIVVDMQQAYFAKDGSLARRGQAICGESRLLSSVTELIQFARSRGMAVIFSRMLFDPDASEPSPAQRRVRSQPGRERDYAPGSLDVELADLPRAPGDRILDKVHYDAFYETDLEDSLRSAGKNRLVIAGVLTNVCVESCVRSAFERGFEIIVVSDGTASYSEDAAAASLAVIRRCFGDVLTLGELRDRLSPIAGPVTP